jgi:Fibronectin type III domain
MGARRSKDSSQAAKGGFPPRGSSARTRYQNHTMSKRLPPRATDSGRPREGWLRQGAFRPFPTALLVAGVLPFAGCTGESPTQVLRESSAPAADSLARTTGSSTVTSSASAERVNDLHVVKASTTTIWLRWTEVDDGTGHPASYRVKYAPPALDWSTATVGCDKEGDGIATQISCAVPGLTPARTYDFQLMSYRISNGSWTGATYSNIDAGETDRLPGIWIGPSEIAARPTWGSAWNSLVSHAEVYCGYVHLEDEKAETNVCIMAKALVFARTGNTTYRGEVVNAIDEIVNSGTYSGRALGLGRNLAAFVIAADLIDLEHYDATLDGRFRSKLKQLRTAATWGGGVYTLVQCQDKRPNNWGAHCGASRIAIDVYLGDSADLARAARVFHGWLGDRSQYAAFTYGSDLTWQCDPKHPVPLNVGACTKNGHSIDGVLPDDQRRAGSFTWPAPKENYTWEAMQGALAQAVLLDRAGYPAFYWCDRALLRAVKWLTYVDSYPASGDDDWQPWVVNHYYGTSFPAHLPTHPGKNVGWTDWTLGG